MPHISIDNALGPHPQALKLRTTRAEVLASNLANGDTPGYLARDIDFAAAMQEALSDGPRLRRSTSVPNPRHLELGLNARGPSGLEAAYRVPLMPSIDGNTVDAEHEQTEMARNNLQIMASIQFLSGRFRGMLTALRGE